MSHELEFIDGRAVFLGREVAWHRLGQVVGDDFDLAFIEQEAPSLLMEVEKVPTFTYLPHEGYIETPRTCAVMRYDGTIVGEGLGKDTYEVVQTRAAFEWALEVAQLGDFPFVSAGSLREGSQYFATMKVGALDLSGFKVDSHLTVAGSHDGSLAVGVWYSHTVAVCANTLASVVGGSQSRMTFKHTTLVEDRMETALRAIEKARDFQAAERIALQALSRIPVKGESLSTALGVVAPCPHDATERVKVNAIERREQIRALFASPVTAGVEGTGLAFVQAVNTFENWGSRVRSKGRSESTARAESQFASIVNDKQPMTKRAVDMVISLT